MQKLVSLLLIVVLCTIPAAAQEVEMADTMRSNGNIYVLVGIILVVLLGFFVYLISLDRKIGKIERKLKG